MMGGMTLDIETGDNAADDVRPYVDPPLTVTAPVPYAPVGGLRNPFPPIADYGFLSDCENTCLVSSAGSIEWLCVPRPDSPSVFGAILDRGAGHFRLAPTASRCPRHAATCPAA
ncbi:glycoside hydrolase 15-like protein [Mycolicibacterium tokaiense]|uniref:Glycoside hydrolase 15-like protein n=1 Tax=Mycolicibacterium tokaiense TaxID=39695 RepID=A0A378TL04_9MYCO|nr:glycoside hydrolase 15-like protein [Mycolicibacterium tokaiense]